MRRISQVERSAFKNVFEMFQSLFIFFLLRLLSWHYRARSLRNMNATKVNDITPDLLAFPLPDAADYSGFWTNDHLLHLTVWMCLKWDQVLRAEKPVNHPVRCRGSLGHGMWQHSYGIHILPLFVRELSYVPYYLYLISELILYLKENTVGPLWVTQIWWECGQNTCENTEKTHLRQKSIPIIVY